MEKCKNPECNEYPQYGVAPHECFYKKGKDFMPGQSTLIPNESWPSNFALEVFEGEKPEDIKYPSACGVFYCPECKNGMKEKIVNGVRVL